MQQPKKLKAKRRLTLANFSKRNVQSENDIKSSSLTQISRKNIFAKINDEDKENSSYFNEPSAFEHSIQLDVSKDLDQSLCDKIEKVATLQSPEEGASRISLTDQASELPSISSPVFRQASHPLPKISNFQSPKKSDSLSNIFSKKRDRKSSIFNSPVRQSPRKKIRTTQDDFEYLDSLSQADNKLARKSIGQFSAAARGPVLKLNKITEYPVDWSIKNSVNLILNRSLFSDLASQKQATKASIYKMDLENELLMISSSQNSLSAKILKSLQYYTFPCIPWAAGNSNLFPRYCKPVKITQNLSDVQSAEFFKTFVSAFTCLFQMFRNNQLPYFYLLNESFSILFKNSEIVLWPATNTLKNKLIDAGINFIDDRPKKNLDRRQRNSPKKSASQDFSNSKSPEKSGKTADDTEPEAEDEFKLAKTPENVKILTKRRYSTSDVNLNYSTNKFSTIKIKGLQLCTRFSKLLQKPDFYEWDAKVNSLPPSLFSPIGFDYGTLKSSELSVKSLSSDTSRLILEISKGVILPHTIYLLLKNLTDRFLEKIDPTNLNLDPPKITGTLETENSTTNLNFSDRNFEKISEEENQAHPQDSVILDSNFYNFIEKEHKLRTVRKFMFNSDGFEIL